MTKPIQIAWTRWGEQVACGEISASMSGTEGWLEIRAERLKQSISLTTRPRHFGGHQWYFICPRTGRLASVLWLPPGAQRFGCRAAWGRQVAYSSQFQSATDRAHSGKAKINSRLCAIGNFDPEEWDLPPKPKWMRWRTYERAVEKFDRYEAALDWGVFRAVAKLVMVGVSQSELLNDVKG